MKLEIDTIHCIYCKNPTQFVEFKNLRNNINVRCKCCNNIIVSKYDYLYYFFLGIIYKILRFVLNNKTNNYVQEKNKK